MTNKEDNIIDISFLIALLFLFSCQQEINAQPGDEITRARGYLGTRGEVIIRFSLPDALTMDELTRNLSIDSKKGDTITAYASEQQFNWFLIRQIPFQTIAPRSVKNPLKQYQKSTAQTWNIYPSYPDYLQIMESFAASYPDLCIMKEFGTSVSGRKLLALKISDNAATDESEPAFLYTSSIHGDEGTGFVLLLRLIDSLLSAYNSNIVIKQLVDNTEIWINPLANPDGFYFYSDTFQYKAKRFNLNNLDLNRNFPDPVAGDHPDGNEWQPENIAMMNFLKEQRIVLAANLHDGAELVNYPWDSQRARHADDLWYYTLSRQFADTVQHHGPEGIFTDEDSGITNGYDWYCIYGGRQDYVNYFLHGREVTIELSHVKTPDPAELPAFWDYYKNSLIGYMQHLHAGVHGTVCDAVTGDPLEASIEIPGYDKDQSQVISSPLTGEFYRLLPTGEYIFEISSPGYYDQIVEVSLAPDEKKNMAVNLMKSSEEFLYYPNPVSHTLNLLLPDDQNNDLVVTISDITGRVIDTRLYTGIRGYFVLNGLENLAEGLYLVRIEFGSLAKEVKIFKIKK
ncbi:MAG: T9SS type A sorting domain-containing protein [Bacteroidales bacterium]|nr:T9SS type A sorting domain-containing protein [Bacteroidales bacterium]